ncbi:MAG: class I SAM-dependent methyltransferase [Gammaproteobacteria bacterium]|nr:class I SAM-dependent methyltransferase [Gammaproteobacteria bacterium]
MNEDACRVGVWCKGEWAVKARNLAQEFNLAEATANDNEFDWLIRYEDDYLCLIECASPKFKPLIIDFDKPTGRITRDDPLRRAIGKGVRVVLDATAGLGSDTVLFLHMGFKVIAAERSAVIAVLLVDALRRCQNKKIRENLSLIHADAFDVLTKVNFNLPEIDVAYMDPMYPARGKSSALAKKECRMLRGLVGDDHDASELLACTRQYVKRVVVKRPPEAPPLADDHVTSFTGKLVRFDVYRGINR